MSEDLLDYTEDSCPTFSPWPFLYNDDMFSSRVISICLLLLAILGLPPLGIVLSGQMLPPHLTPLPIPTKKGIVSSSWPIMGLLAILIFITLTPFVYRFLKNVGHDTYSSTPAKRFPWWGWLAAGWITLVWIMAWTRFSWIQDWQPYTFPLLWFGYIVVINALCFSRTGWCMITHQPAYLFKLFLLSAGFWWMFEYLNQFVQNWHYVGLVPAHPLLTYTWFTLSFSTVLPAVLGTYDYLSSVPKIRLPFENWLAISSVNSPNTGWLMFILGCFGLLTIGVWPTRFFSFLWLSPLLIMLGLEIIRKVPTILSPLARGNWAPLVLSSLSALVCGWFWEMWNAYSLVHWEYSIPYVQAVKIFEMPVLGYAGYLPFGLECLTVVSLFLGKQPADGL